MPVLPEPPPRSDRASGQQLSFSNTFRFSRSGLRTDRRGRPDNSSQGPGGSGGKAGSVGRDAGELGQPPASLEGGNESSRNGSTVSQPNCSSASNTSESHEEAMDEEAMPENCAKICSFGEQDEQVRIRPDELATHSPPALLSCLSYTFPGCAV